MNNYIPNMYKKSISDINYSKLKQMGIKCIIFDLDNTLALIDEKKISKKTEEYINELKKDFNIVIISNNTKKRISKFCKSTDLFFVSFAMKPLPRGFIKIKEKYKLKKDEMCIVGDQLITDIFGGNKYGIFTILVDPLGEKDLKITSLNRFLEKILLRKFAKKKLLERGKYYE